MLVSFYAHDRPSLKSKLIFRPYEVKRNKAEAHRFISHAFVHAHLPHLMLNMLVLYLFGTPLEQFFKYEYGTVGLYYFILLYFGGAVFSSIYSYIKHKDNIMYGSLGASGATMALVFSYIALRPTATMQFIMLPIPMPAIVFGFVILAIEYYMDRRGNSGIAHDAHIFGALYGFGFTVLIDIENWRNFIHQIQHAW